MFVNGETFENLFFANILVEVAMLVGVAAYQVCFFYCFFLISCIASLNLNFAISPLRNCDKTLRFILIQVSFPADFFFFIWLYSRLG